MDEAADYFEQLQSEQDTWISRQGEPCDVFAVTDHVRRMEAVVEEDVTDFGEFRKNSKEEMKNM